MRRWEPLAHVALLLAALLACGGGKKGNDDSSKPEPGAAAETAVTVAPGDLIADYKANEVRGDSKWKGKLVRLTGTVGSIGKDFTDSAYVIIGDEIGDNIHCMLASGEEAKAGNLNKGSRATFKGRVNGLTVGTVMLADCQIVPAGAAPAAAPQPQAPAKAQPVPVPRPPAAKKK